ncbi:MAG: hypothetical protein WC702_02825 [Patescibacteria group bacterium]|jgi:Trk-type K+ transport system membrane component
MFIPVTDLPPEAYKLAYIFVIFSAIGFWSHLLLFHGRKRKLIQHLFFMMFILGVITGLEVLSRTNYITGLDGAISFTASVCLISGWFTSVMYDLVEKKWWEPQNPTKN